MTFLATSITFPAFLNLSLTANILVFKVLLRFFKTHPKNNMNVNRRFRAKNKFLVLAGFDRCGKAR